MKREIKFRGKIRGRASDKTTGQWIYGYYKKDQHGEFINDIYVDPKTVGQYTGLDDKNGHEIYEGDILQGNVADRWWLVERDEVFAGFALNMVGEDGHIMLSAVHAEKLEVIGDIY